MWVLGKDGGGGGGGGGIPATFENLIQNSYCNRSPTVTDHLVINAMQNLNSLVVKIEQSTSELWSNEGTFQGHTCIVQYSGVLRTVLQPNEQNEHNFIKVAI